MRAVICRAWGEVDGLRIEDVAPPAPGPDDVVISVKATAVNYADALMPGSGRPTVERRISSASCASVTWQLP